MRFPDLRMILAGIRWAATGAAAARLYMPERMTNDLDILIDKADSGRVKHELLSAGAQLRGELSIGGTAWTLKEGFPLDIIERSDEWVGPALDEAQGNLDPQGMPVLSLPYQVLMKFQASRVQDLADITRMLAQASDAQLDATRRLFKDVLPKDMEDLESLLILGRMELEGEGGES